jgi:hypothetical protein
LVAALEALQADGFDQGTIEAVTLDQVTGAYEGDIRTRTVDETVISGALGGAIFGSMFGAVAGAAVLFFPELETMMDISMQSAWSVVALGGTLAGAFFGVILGFLVGLGVAEEDRYLYDDSIRYGTELIMLETDSERAREAARIMHQINAAARTRAAV